MAGKLFELFCVQCGHDTLHRYLYDKPKEIEEEGDIVICTECGEEYKEEGKEK